MREVVPFRRRRFHAHELGHAFGDELFAKDLVGPVVSVRKIGQLSCEISHWKWLRCGARAHLQRDGVAMSVAQRRLSSPARELRRRTCSMNLRD